MNAATKSFTAILNTYAPNGDFIDAKVLGSQPSVFTSNELLEMVALKVTHLTHCSYDLIVKSPSGGVKHYPKVIDQAIENSAHAAYMNR